MTVSKVLRGRIKGSYAKSAKQMAQIQKIASDLGYRPNAAARAVKSGRLGNVGLVLSTKPGRSYLPGSLIDGIHDELTANGLHLIYARMPDDVLLGKPSLPRLLEEWAADGLLINYSNDMPAGLEKLIDSHHLPAVWINLKRASDCVGPDDVQAGRIGTEHLIALGHRRIAYLHLKENEASRSYGPHSSEPEREQGYREAMLAAGLRPQSDSIAVSWNTDSFQAVDGRLEGARAWIVANPRVTGVMTYSETTAAPLMYAAAEAGRRVPNDLSIVSVGPIVSSAFGIPMTTVLTEFGSVGHHAVKQLLARIAGASPLMPLTVPPRLVVGQSTAKRP